MRCTFGERVLISAKTAIVASVNEFVRRRRRFDQDPEPAERIDALIVLPQCLGH